ncbi:MAG: hypothetical protein ACT4OT_10550 [Acidobacteriota bacterium]
MSTILRALVPLTLILITWSGCNRGVDRKPSGPALSGRLFALDQTSHKLYEIIGSAVGRAEFRVIGENVLDAAISPDQKFLLYRVSVPGPSHKNDRLILRELSSGQEKAVISGVSAQVPSWATDSQKFSYHAENSLHVSDLVGNSQVVYSAPHAKYTLLSATGVSLGAKEMYAKFTRATWIGPDRFVFQRYRGDMPYAPALAWNEAFVEPNVTTVVMVGSKATLVDVNKKWIVRGVCGEKSLLLLSEDYRQGPFYLASSTADLRHPSLRALPDIPSQTQSKSDPESRKYDFLMVFSETVGFLPRSCQIFSMRGEAEFKRTMISYIDPDTLAQQAPVELKGVGEIKSWTFASDGKHIAIVHKEQGLDSLSIVNVETRDVRSLGMAGVGGPGLGDWRLVGWIF